MKNCNGTVSRIQYRFLLTLPLTPMGELTALPRSPGFKRPYFLGREGRVRDLAPGKILARHWMNAIRRIGCLSRHSICILLLACPLLQSEEFEKKYQHYQIMI